MLKNLASNALRKHLALVLKDIAGRKDSVPVARKSKPTAALVSLDLFEDILALTSTDYLKDIRQARSDYRAGRTLNHRAVFGRI